jgi:hypothetical protein
MDERYIENGCAEQSARERGERDKNRSSENEDEQPCSIARLIEERQAIIPVEWCSTSLRPVASSSA